MQWGGRGGDLPCSAEVIERTLPIRVERLELNTRDGPSFGKYRGGGFGIVKDYRILCSEASFSASFGRSRFTAWGGSGRWGG
ncbi:hydantoinase B/oxoprolinase family protein, partial [Thermogymnomonas acidicola]|uniref:hydantoinase B/oxoprolinase family protein n=1 Tax=Thermogymnomonas acidicola TaxID=399579 RepID=UPI001493F6B4